MHCIFGVGAAQIAAFLIVSTCDLNPQLCLICSLWCSFSELFYLSVQTGVNNVVFLLLYVSIFCGCLSGGAAASLAPLLPAALSIAALGHFISLNLNVNSFIERRGL